MAFRNAFKLLGGAIQRGAAATKQPAQQQRYDANKPVQLPPPRQPLPSLEKILPKPTMGPATGPRDIIPTPKPADGSSRDKTGTDLYPDTGDEFADYQTAMQQYLDEFGQQWAPIQEATEASQAAMLRQMAGQAAGAGYSPVGGAAGAMGRQAALNAAQQMLQAKTGFEQGRLDRLFDVVAGGADLRRALGSEAARVELEAALMGDPSALGTEVNTTIPGITMTGPGAEAVTDPDTGDYYTMQELQAAGIWDTLTPQQRDAVAFRDKVRSGEQRTFADPGENRSTVMAAHADAFQALQAAGMDPTALSEQQKYDLAVGFMEMTGGDKEGILVNFPWLGEYL